jgi:hypothetical protein
MAADGLLLTDTVEEAQARDVARGTESERRVRSACSQRLPCVQEGGVRATLCPTRPAKVATRIRPARLARIRRPTGSAPSRSLTQPWSSDGRRGVPTQDGHVPTTRTWSSTTSAAFTPSSRSRRAPKRRCHCCALSCACTTTHRPAISIAYDTHPRHSSPIAFSRLISVLAVFRGKPLRSRPPWLSGDEWEGGRIRVWGRGGSC